MVYRIVFTIAPDHIVSALNYLNNHDVQILAGDSSGDLAHELGLSVNYMWHTILCETDDLSLNIINVNGINYNGQLV